MVRLRRRGHDVRVLCSDFRLPGAEAADPAEEQHVERRLRPYFRDGEPWAPSFGEQLAIERHNQAALAGVIERFRPDVVAAWQFGALSLSLLTSVVERRLPLVCAVCDDWLVYGTELDRWAHRWHGTPLRHAAGRLARPLLRTPTVVADLGANATALFVSDLVRRAARDASPWWFAREAVVGSGIDRTDFPAADGPPRTRPFEGRLLYTGRLDPRKGTETAVRALVELPGAVLTMLGRGGDDERARLEKLASHLGVADRLELGMRARHELAASYRAADVMLFPSEWAEPFGLTPLEAMACDTPVVATAVGGSAEFLVDGVNCLVVPPADPAALAAAVRRLAADEDLRRRLVEGGRSTSAELDVDHLADRFEAWYEAAAAGAPSGPRWLPPRPAAASDAGQGGRRADPFARHHHATAAALSDGDAAGIKALYVDLGADVWTAMGDEPASVPVLSVPETHPVVAARFPAGSGRILDAGCGPNPAVSITLAGRPGNDVVSVDIGAGMVRTARQVAATHGVALVGVVGDVECLPFRSGAFDGAVCDDTIEHLPDDAAGVAELARVLRRGGRAVLATPNRWSAAVLAAKLRDRLADRRRPARAYYAAESHLREYTWGGFERLTSKAFARRARLPVGWREGSKRRALTRLLAIPGLLRLSQIVVLEVEPR
jgi:glycosyltransferase involved in cell wall biosynthesis/SAM-dependent methyltransferase